MKLTAILFMVLFLSCTGNKYLGQTGMVISKEIEPTKVYAIDWVGRTEIDHTEVAEARKVYVDNQDFTIRVLFKSGDTVKFYLLPSHYESLSAGEVIEIKHCHMTGDFNWTYFDNKYGCE